MSWQSVSIVRNAAGGGTPATRETDISFEFDKEIFPRFALGVSENFQYLAPRGQQATYGFDNIELGAKYQLLMNAPHEAIFSVGTKWDIGGTGAKHVGADSFSTFTPTVYFGKGFGDIPDAVGYLKPFAVTGTLGQELPTSAQGAKSLDWGLAVEYSLPYLQAQVKDIGIPAPFKNMIPLVEFSMQTGENQGQEGLTTGTINPGVLYENNYFQLGAEAIIPANSRTSHSVGAIIQIQIYIDDIWPNVFGHPIFGK